MSASGRRRPDPEDPPVVIRDKRKFDADGNLRTPTGTGQSPAPAGPGGPPVAGGPPGFDPVEVGAAPLSQQPLSQQPLSQQPLSQQPLSQQPLSQQPLSQQPLSQQPLSQQPLSQQDVDARAEVLDLRTQLADRTADLQRLSAEYANYRKRVDRDRVVIGEVATGQAVAALLPVLDDIKRADDHGDLDGAFKAVADKLVAALAGLGLEPFGTAGDPFDPSLHEAVMHTESADVQVPTASMIMRRGYRLRDRLLRPAMVGVTAPASEASASDAPASDAPASDAPASEAPAGQPSDLDADGAL